MTQPERFPPDDPREWMNRARSNLALASNGVAGAYLEDLCPSYMHDLGRLLSIPEMACKPIEDPARFPWHGVSTVQHNWLEFSAMTRVHPDTGGMGNP